MTIVRLPIRKVVVDRRSESLQAACCLIINDDGKILSVSRKDDPTQWGMPGGKVDPGESIEQAAVRELREETGLIASNLVKVFTHKEDDGYTTTTFTCDVAGEINTDESGVIRWVDAATLMNFQYSPFASYNKRMFNALSF